MGLSGRGGAPTGGNSNIQVLGRKISFAELMATAFDVDVYKLVLPPGAPAGGFDLLMTGPDATRKRLQAEIKSQLGYVAHLETRPTNILLLTLRQADAPGLQPSKATAIGSTTSIGGGSWRFSNVPISSLAGYLQNYFDPPIFDRSGLSGRFDISLSVDLMGTNAMLRTNAIMQGMSEQLGLALSPGTEPLDLLVVEPAKAD
jgi:uncharacterized protein (TIGR03435 family)